MAHDVFISYASKDKPTADAACAMLEQRGIRCWIAPRDMLPGADWGAAIIDAINDARAFVLVFSSHANASQQIKREVERAVNKGIPIIPVRIEDVAPTKTLEYFISSPHWLDAFSPPLERHLAYLSDVIEHLLKGEALPQPLPLPLKRRRLVVMGVAAAAAVVALIGLWQLTRGAAQPSFVGKWKAERVTLNSGSLNPSGPSYATDIFAKAALSGPDVTGALEIDSLGQYRFSLAAEDRGTVMVSGNLVTFTSDINHVATTLGFVVVAPQAAQSFIAALGGQAGESALALTPAPPMLQTTLAGTPAGRGSGGLDAIIGHWHIDVPANGVIAETHVSLDIAADGRYRFRGETRENGLWDAADGKWTRTPQGAPPQSGTYRFDGRNRVTYAGVTGTSAWVRAE
jgi:hypothetical protein